MEKFAFFLTDDRGLLNKKRNTISALFHTVKYTGSDDYDVQNRKKNIIEQREPCQDNKKTDK